MWVAFHSASGFSYPCQMERLEHLVIVAAPFDSIGFQDRLCLYCSAALAILMTFMSNVQIM